MRTISLPDSLHIAAEEMAAQAGFASAEEYIADLVRRDVEQNPQEPSAPLRQIVEEAASRTLTDAEWERYNRRLESLLIEGLDSGPATPMVAEDWAELHRRVEARLARKDPYWLPSPGDLLRNETSKKRPFTSARTTNRQPLDS